MGQRQWVWASLRLALAVFALMVVAPVSGSITGTGVAMAQTVVRSIDVDGNRRVEDATVISYMTLSVGRPYSTFQADESLKALFQTGLFSDVNIVLRGSTVFVTVVENPIVNRVAFEGNKKIKDEVLAAEVQLAPRAVYTRAKVQSDTQRILEIYRRTGRFGAQVTPKIIELPQNRIDLVFEIDENKKTGVTRISFIGNRAFGEGTLREVITTNQSRFFNFFGSTDVYDPDRLQADQELLRRYYLKKGYADFRVVSAVADFDPESNAFFITFTLDEGERYRFGNVEIETSLSGLDPTALRSHVRTKPGDIYNAELVDKSAENLTVEVATRGYAFVRVRPSGERDIETLTINIVYVIEEGPRVYIERINIRGNTRTLDRVIRREFDLAEGDAFNAVLVQRAERRLNALGFFKTVRVSRAPGSSPDRVIVNVDVEEQPTGELSFGAGYSTSDGIIGDVSVTERNLLGRGQYVRVALSVSAVDTEFDFSFTEPWFLDRRVSAGIDAFYRSEDREDESSFTSERVGGGVRLGFLIAEDLTMNVRYTFSREDVEVGTDLLPDYDADGDGDLNGATIGGITLREANLRASDILLYQSVGRTVVPTNVSPYVLATEGVTNTSAAGFVFTYNKLDFPRRPRNGYRAQLSTDFAGLGGDTYYARAVVDARYYREVIPNVIAIAKVEAGHIHGLNGDVNINDSFFKGSSLIRGFRRSGFGPRAQRTLPGPDGVLFTGDDIVNFRDALGGTTFWGTTAEVRFPVYGLPESLGIRGAVFADAGSLFNVGDLGPLPTTNTSAANGPNIVSWSVVDDASVRAALGFGILWDSPFGPLRADFAWPILEESYDRTQVFRFSGGTRF